MITAAPSATNPIKRRCFKSVICLIKIVEPATVIGFSPAPLPWVFYLLEDQEKRGGADFLPLSIPQI